MISKESHLATIVSAEISQAEPQADGIWFTYSDLMADDVLTMLNEAISEDSLMIYVIPSSRDGPLKPDLQAYRGKRCLRLDDRRPLAASQNRKVTLSDL